MDNTQKKTTTPTIHAGNLTEHVTRLDWNSDNACRQRQLLRERIEDIETTATRINNLIESHEAILQPTGAFAHRINVIETKTTWAHETGHSNLRSIADCGGDILTHTAAIEALSSRVTLHVDRICRTQMAHSAAIEDIETHTAGLDAAIERLDAVDIRAAVDARVGELCYIAAVGVILLSAVFVAAATASAGAAHTLGLFL